MRGSLSLLAVALLVATSSCGRDPQPNRSQPASSHSSPRASSSSHPTAFTGKPQPHEDPVEALRARTYVVTTHNQLVHAGTTAGVVTWSFKDRAQPKQLATLVLPGSVSGLTLFGPSQSILAVSTGPTGLVLVDTSNGSRGRLDRLSDAPWKPADRGNCHSAWNSAAVDDARGFVACGTGGVAEVDFRDRSRPRVTRSIDLDGYVRDIAILDARAGLSKDKGSARLVAAAAGNAGLVILDFPAGQAPNVLARLDTSGESRALEVHDAIAYVADGPAGLRIVDLRDPLRPAELSRFDPKTVDLARGVTVQGKTAYLCLGDSGLVAVDVSNPKAPRRLGAIDPRRALNRATVDGSVLYAANDAGGILLVDITRPDSLVQLFPPPDQK